MTTQSPNKLRIGSGMMKPMRVGLDVTAKEVGFKRHASRGIGRYASELSSRLLDGSGPPRHPDVTIAPFRHTALPLPGWLESGVRLLGEHRHVARQHMLFSGVFTDSLAKRFDMLHFLSQLDAPAWCALPYCVTVHDVIPLVLAERHQSTAPLREPWRRRLSLRLEQKAIAGALHVVTVSHASARDIERLTTVSAENISVVYNGVGPEFLNPPQKPAAQIRAELKLPADRDLILYVGGIDPRKNVIGLISIFEQTCKRAIDGSGQRTTDNASRPPVLVIAGDTKADENYGALRRRIEASPLRSAIHEIGYLSDEDLRSLLGTTAVFAFPSLYEGFGLPPLEACAAGVPVVSSNRSCLPEILGDGAVLCDPEDHGTFSANLWDILSNPDHAQAVSRRGMEHARAFTWDKTAEGTLAVYERLARQRTLRRPASSSG
jgi:glycosyltransferase involved in cell wall biosynthesis